MLILLILFSVSIVFAEYCIQVAANPNFEVIKKYYEHVKKFENARIEKKGNIYLLRVGATNIRSELQAILPFIKRKFPDAYIKICEINDKYVVYPKKETDIIEKPGTVKEVTSNINFASYEKEIAQIKETVNLIKEKIESMNLENSKEMQYVEISPSEFLKNFIIITGAVVFTLLFFMFVLLIIILRSIKKSNGDVMKVFLEMINALKILNLLNNGHVLKMEGGKLLVWDEKERKWKEVKS